MITFNNLEFIAPCKIQNDDSHSLLQAISYKSLLFIYLFIIYHNTINLADNLLNSILHQHYIFMELQTPLPGTSYILSRATHMLQSHSDLQLWRGATGLWLTGRQFHKQTRVWCTFKPSYYLPFYDFIQYKIHGNVVHMCL